MAQGIWVRNKPKTLYVVLLWFLQPVKRSDREFLRMPAIARRERRVVYSRPCLDPRTLGAAPLRLATWNINSVRLRIHLVRRLIEAAAPDVLCLQETKTPGERFPREAL